MARLLAGVLANLDDEPSSRGGHARVRKSVFLKHCVAPQGGQDCLVWDLQFLRHVSCFRIYNLQLQITMCNLETVRNLTTDHMANVVLLPSCFIMKPRYFMDVM